MNGALLSIVASLLCISAVVLGSLPVAVVGFVIALLGLIVSVGERLAADDERAQVHRIVERERERRRDGR